MSSTTLLERTKSFHPQLIDLSLERMKRLLAAIDNPQRRLPSVVHVAGTNGKGSVIAFVRAIAEGMGKRVHAYTSPHLIDFHERIALAGQDGARPIAETALVDCLARAEEANNGELITSFELATAAAFLAFAETPADLLLLETGLGGRLDATNVVENPVATILTPVSIDHVSFLGNTVEAIAEEKAGILKGGVPCIVGRQKAAALEVIRSKAEAIRAPLQTFGRDFRVSECRRRLIVETAVREFDLPLPSLLGRHQIDNAGTAIATAMVVFGEGLADSDAARGMLTTTWPARLELLPPGVLDNYVNKGTEIWLDGGHNAAGAEVIAAALTELNNGASRPVHLIWGMLDTKDARSVIAQFRGVIDRVYTVPIPDERNAYSAEVLAVIAASEDFEVTVARSVPHALLMSQAALGSPGRVLIWGSLYLAGHVFKLHGGDSSLLAKDMNPVANAGLNC